MKDNLLEAKSLVLFFTEGISLAKWDHVGNFTREIALYNLLADHFKEIYFVTYGDPKEELKYQGHLKPNIKILPKRIPFLPNKLYSFLISFVYWHVFKQADILKTNQMTGAHAAVFVKILFKKKLIVRCGYELLKSCQSRGVGTLKLKYIRCYEEFVYKMADNIVITTQALKDFILINFNVDERKVKVIPNFIDTELFRPMPHIERIKGRICYVGRLERSPKNIDSLFKALVDLPVHLVIFGSCSGRENFGDLVKDLGVDVRFMGNLSNDKLPEELNKSTIFVLPSFFEGNPKALLEAMSCGLPCVGTNVDGIRDIIRDRENGILCNTDFKSIHDSIKMILEDDKLKALIGTNARITLERYSLSRIVSNELVLFSTL